jgi:hypothetical protein
LRLWVIVFLIVAAEAAWVFRYEPITLAGTRGFGIAGYIKRVCPRVSPRDGDAGPRKDRKSATPISSGNSCGRLASQTKRSMII